MRNIMNRVIAFILMLVMAIFLPVQTLAAATSDKEIEYISEMQVFSKADFDNYVTMTANGDKQKENELKQCKTWTSDNGFTVINKDVNAKKEEDISTNSDAVYIGYKTTNNVNEAITDTAVMDMKGGYSFTKYEDILKKQENEIQDKVDYLAAAIKEYRENYNKKSAGALYAYEQLNLLVDGDVNDKYAGEGNRKDSGQKLGDYFLTDISNDKLIKIIMQSNSVIMQNVYIYLGIGCADSNKKNWAAGMSALTNTEIKELTSKQYDDQAKALLTSVHQLQDELDTYADEIEDLPLTSTSEEIEAYISDLTDNEKTSFRISMELYRQLDQYKYGDTTIAEFFSGKKLTAKQIYPLAKVLTPGQQAIAYNAGLHILFSCNGLMDEKQEKAEKETGATLEQSQKMIKEYTGNETTLSIYEGVERKLFYHGVACTSAQQRAEANTTDNTNPFIGNLNRKFEIIALSSMLISTVAAVYSTWYIYSYYGAGYVIDAVGDRITASVTEQFINGVRNCFGKGVINYDTAIVNAKSSIKIITRDKTQWVISNVYVLRAVVAVGMFIEWAYSLSMFSYYLYSEFDAYYHPTMTEKPIAMVDYGIDEDLNHVPITYDAVLQYNTSNEDVVADLNAGKAKQWNVLYVTKDTNAGKPLTVESDIIYKTGSGNSISLDKYTALHYFGETNAFNLNTHSYTDDLKGIYMFFPHAEEVPVTSSVFGSGNIIAIYLMAGIAGIALGAMGGYTVGRRKRTKKEQ